MGVTQYRLAMNLKIPHSRVTAIIRGRRAISPDTALRLSRYFGTSAEFWIGLQQEFDLRKARAETGKDIESQVPPLAFRPQKEQGFKAKNTDQPSLPQPNAPQVDLFADF